MEGPQKTGAEGKSVLSVVRSLFPPAPGKPEEKKPVNKEKLLFNFFVIDMIVVVIRIAVSVLSNSMAMYTTAARAIISLLTAFIAWVCMRFASKDESDAFNYGYGKLETISSVMKGAALLISFIIIMYTALDRLNHPGKLTPVGAEIAIAFSFFFTCGNVYRWFRIRRILSSGDRSPVLWSQYKATNASVIVNAGSFLSVLLSVLLAGYWFGPYIDPVMSILLSGFILIFAYSILSNSMTDLLDKALDESMQLLIVRALAEFFDEYTQILGVRSRRSGGMVFVEIILEFEADRPIGDIQRVIDRMQQSLEGKIQNSRITIVPRSADAVPAAAPQVDA